MAMLVMLPSAPFAQPAVYSRCVAVDVASNSPASGPATGRIVGVPGDRVRWSKTALFINDVRFSEVCDRQAQPPLPFGSNDSEIEVLVLDGQYFVASSVRLRAPEDRYRLVPTKVVRYEFGLVPAARLLAARLP
jgi:hypothetical protein